MKLQKTVLALSALILLAPFGRAEAAEGPGATRVLAVVGGRPVTARDVEARLLLEDLDPSKADGGQWQEALSAEIDRIVLVEAAKREKVEVTDDEVAGRIEAARSGLGADEYKRRIALLGLDGAGERTRTREQMLVDRLITKKMGTTLFVPPAAIAEWYEKNKDLLKGPEVRVARVITLKPGESGLDAARKRLEEIREKVKAGEDFAALARTVSADPWASSGGLLPPVVQYDSGSVFAARMFEMQQVGEVTEVFETPAGLHILRLEEIRPGRVPPFEEAQEAIRERLLRQLRLEHVSQLVQELRLRTPVKILWENMPGSSK